MRKGTSAWLLECFGLASLNPRNSEYGWGIEFCLSSILAQANTGKDRLPRIDDYTRVLSLLSARMGEIQQTFSSPKGQGKADTDLLIRALFIRDYHYGIQSLLEAAFIYERHNDWLRNCFGFEVGHLLDFAIELAKIMHRRFPDGAFDDPPDPDHAFWAKGWITFDGYLPIRLPSKIILRTYGPRLEFSAADFADLIPRPAFQAILNTFSRCIGEYPPQANILDACALTRYPFLRMDGDSFLLPHVHLLPTAIVEAPELLIQQDEAYYAQVLRDRGPISEDRLEAVLSPAFGPTFIFRNQLNPKGKELSDFVVWNGEQTIILESKYSGRVAWEGSLERHGAKILKRMDQAYGQLGGALRSLTESKDPMDWVNVAGGAARFGIFGDSEIHLIAVLTEHIRSSLLASEVKALQIVRDHWVHYFSIKDLARLLRYLSTIADFCHYLREREKALRTGKFVDQFEEDMLGWYLRHGKTFGLDWIEAKAQTEGSPDFVTFPGFWEEVALKYKVELRGRFLADRVSYWVDHVLKILAPQYGPNQPVVRELGKLDRLARRMIGEHATRKAWQAAEQARPVWTVCGPESLSTRFLLIFAPKDWPREKRRVLLDNLLAGGFIKSGAKRIVGIASEAADSEVQSYDFGYLEGPLEWTEDERQSAEKMFGLPHHTTVKECPEEIAGL